MKEPKTTIVLYFKGVPQYILGIKNMIFFYHAYSQIFRLGPQIQSYFLVAGTLLVGRNLQLEIS